MFSVRFHRSGQLRPQWLLPLTSKAFELNLRYLRQSIYRSGEMYCMTFPWPWPTVKALALISKNLLVCIIKRRTTHLITAKHGCFIALIMVINWLDFGEVMLKTVILANFPLKLRMCFFKVKHYLAISQERLVRLMWNEKEVHQLDTGYNMWPWPLTSLIILTLEVSRSNFEIALS